AEHRPEGAGGAEPGGQVIGADAHRMLEVLVGAGTVPVERNAEAVDAQLGHDDPSFVFVIRSPDGRSATARFDTGRVFFRRPARLRAGAAGAGDAEDRALVAVQQALAQARVVREARDAR